MIQRIKATIQQVLPNNPFVRGVTVLVGGTAGAQLLTVLAAPLLTRLYSPEDFGMLAVYASLLALISIISSLRYELAIPLPEDDAEAANVAALSLILVGLSTLLAGFMMLLASQPLANVLGLPGLARYLWLLPIGVLFGGTYTILNYWSVRTKRFTTIASTKLRQAVAMIALQLTAFKLGDIALLYGHVVGQSVGMASLGRPALKNQGFKQVKWQGIIRTARTYRRFPIFSTWEGLLNTVSHELAPLGFAALYGASVAGYYALAHRVLSIPITLIGTAVSQVFFATAANARDKAKVKVMFEGLSGILAHTGLPPIILMALMAPEIFEHVFGVDWRYAGIFAQWMAPWLYLQFISSPLSPIFWILEEQKQGMLWQLLLLFFRSIALGFGGVVGSIELAIIYFSVASALAYAIQVLWLSRLVDAKHWLILKHNIIALTWGLMIASPIIITALLELDAVNYYLMDFVASCVLLVLRYIYILRDV